MIGNRIIQQIQGKERVCLELPAYAALLRMLVKRATLPDRMRALYKSEHWLHRARIELALITER